MVFYEAASFPWYVCAAQDHHGSFQEASPLLSFHIDGRYSARCSWDGLLCYSIPPILWANWTKAPVAAMMTAQMKTFLSLAQRSVRCMGDWSLSIMIQMA